MTLADTSCGYGCFATLPEGATGFTTIELKTNHLGTALDGTIVSRATPVHLGRTTQVWDAVVTHKESGKTWRCSGAPSCFCTPNRRGPVWRGLAPCSTGSVTASTIAAPVQAPVAQLDRVSASEAEGHWFESSRARQFNKYNRLR